jgi:uncharacterized protein (DUF983 family)
MITTTINMFGNKCPNCNKGNIFEKGLLHFNFSFPKMHENCSNCGTKFEKEPGFFFGAMFVSYLLTLFACRFLKKRSI